MSGKNKLDIDNYKIEQELGRGGMATVYLATQSLLSRKVALKVMLPEFSQAVFQDVFLHEGKVVAQLEHPNIVRIYDIGISDGYFYMAMEYLAGGSLRERLNNGTFSPNQVAQILGQVGAGLAFSHQQGFIHRDIKPENILFRQNDEAVLTDFGIAKLQNSTGEMTRMGLTAGTAHYMSPEQAATSDLDSRSDLYSLALVAYEMLCGEKVCNADSLVQAIHQHTVLPPPDLPEKYQLFQPILHKALAKRATDRFNSVQEFIAAFADAVQRYEHEQSVTHIMTVTPEAVLADDTQMMDVKTDPAIEPKVSDKPAAVVLSDKTPFWHKPLPVILLTAAMTVGISLFVIMTMGNSGETFDTKADKPASVINIQPTRPVTKPVVPVDNNENTGQSSSPVGAGGQEVAEPVSGEELSPVDRFTNREVIGLTGKAFVVTSSDGLNLRSIPRKENDNALDKLEKDTKVTIISDTVYPQVIRGQQKEWVKVRYAGKTGYVYNAYLKPVAELPALASGCRYKEGQSEKSYVINNNGARLFEEPFSTDRIADLPREKVVDAVENALCPDTVNGRSGNWIKVKGQGFTGYLFDLDAFPLNKEAERVRFASGAISHGLRGEFATRRLYRFVLAAGKGQRMYVQKRLPSSAKIYVYGEDNQVIASDTNIFDRTLPTTQDYYITFFDSDNARSAFHYEIFIR